MVLSHFRTLRYDVVGSPTVINNPVPVDLTDLDVSVDSLVPADSYCVSKPSVIAALRALPRMEIEVLASELNREHPVYAISA